MSYSKSTPVVLVMHFAYVDERVLIKSHRAAKVVDLSVEAGKGSSSAE